MCDYSLGGIPSRLAVEGEDLIVHRFPTHSIGLASPIDIQAVNGGALPRESVWQQFKKFFAPVSESCRIPAVCIPPGAELMLTDIPATLQRKWSTGPTEKVLFIQTSAEENTYRDGVRFCNGRQVLLQELKEGMPVNVLSLGAETENERLLDLEARRLSIR